MRGTGRFAEASETSRYTPRHPCFVDDLVVYSSRKREVRHYQAKKPRKDVRGVPDRGSLRSDFANQLKLSTALKLKCKLVLAVSNRANSKRLSTQIPSNLKGNASVLYFPYRLRLTGLLRANFFLSVTP